MQKDTIRFSIYCGLILASLLVFITTFVYAYDSDLMLFSFGLLKPLLWVGGVLNLYAVIWYVVIFFFPIICLLKFISINYIGVYVFKDYFSIIFLILCTSLFIYTIYTVGFYILIDNSLMINNDNYIIMSLGENSIDSSPLYDIFLNAFTLKSQIQLYVFALIPCILYSTIISLFVSLFRKKI
jgi:hypothetical protein